jgi:glucose/mannose-6-phosphate isomerase
LNLDDLSSIAAGDPSGMLAAVEAWPDQWYEGLERARGIAASKLPSAKGVDAVAVCGVGGSGVAGQVLRALAGPRSPVPVAVVRSYELPAFVGPKTLVFCVSYSGGTEETLTNFDAALERGARIVAISGPGELARRAGEAGVPVIAPVEGLTPRAAFPSLASVPPALLDRIGLAPGLGLQLDDAQSLIAELVGRLRREMPERSNEAKRIAARLDGHAVHVWGSEGALAVAAERWKTQMNENAKLPASWAALPELAHNEVVGYEDKHPALAETALVILGSAGEDVHISRVRAAAAEMAASRYAVVVQIDVGGATHVARLAAGVVLGDFTSVYLALLRGVDPTPMDAIGRLKAAVTAQGGGR